MLEKTIFAIIVTLLLSSMLTLGFIAQPAEVSEPLRLGTDENVEMQTFATGSGKMQSTFRFSAPIVSKGSTFDSVAMSGLPERSVPGEPLLPFRMVKVLIPRGKCVESVDVNVGARKMLQGEFYVGYGKTPVPTYLDSIVIDRPDEAIYASADPYPGELFSDMLEQYMRGYEILALKLYPVHYIPATGKLFYFDTMILTVTLKETDEASPMFRGLPQDAELVMSMVDDPQAVDENSAAMTHMKLSNLVDPSDTYAYVIITNSSLESSFQSLIDAKTARGLTATIVTLEDIMKEPAYSWDGQFGDGYNLPWFNDTQAHIRNFIKDAYQNWETDYILLGGDVEVIPCREVYCYAGNYTKSDIPCDTYYAALDGSWDADLDGMFGETLYRWATPPPGHTVTPSNGTAGEEADFLPEVYVGRAPVTTETQVTRFIEKTLAYEQDTQTNPEAVYLQNALLVGEKSDAITQDGNGLDSVADIIQQYSLTKIYARDGWQIDPLPPWDSWLTTGLLESDRFQIVCHSGHASPNRVMGISRSGASGLTNTKYFLMYSLGCDTTAFDTDSVAEHFMTSTTGGAFAYVGNSRYGMYVQGSVDGPGDRYMRQFFSLLNSGVTNIGKALALSKVQEPTLDRWIIFVLNLLGDPETELFTAVKAPTAHFETRTDLLASPRIGGMVEIRGTAKSGVAEGATFSNYLIEFGSGIDPSTWNATGMALANNGQSEVVNGTLAVWNTTLVNEGVYSLRLRALDTEELVGEDRMVVVVRRAAVPICIRTDGSVDPATEFITRDGDLYTLTGNIAAEGDVIVIQRDNIILDGAGFTVQGVGRYETGIRLTDRGNITIKNMVVTECLYGIFLGSSSNNTISGCRIQGNTHGLFFYTSSNNEVFGNNVTTNDYGIALIYFSNNNKVHENWITNHQGRDAGALWFYCSSDNSFLHNVFVSNYRHVYDAAWDCADTEIVAVSMNVWDNGYPSGGNYWSDYMGIDEKNGPNQDQTGGDGMGDTPYIIDSSDLDHYPLMKPYAGSHDIGIISIISKTAVGQGYHANATVRIVNYGTNDETFNVTLYFNTTIIGKLSDITLTSRNSANLDFALNITGFERGNYTLITVVDSVPGETDITDNTRESDLVQVGVPCDITGQTPQVPDGVCNMRDIGYICSKFGTTPSSQDWNPNADVTGPTPRTPDGTVNMRDIGEACSNFGET